MAGINLKAAVADPGQLMAKAGRLNKVGIDHLILASTKEGDSTDIERLEPIILQINAL